jgi:hypothetical protein
MMPVLLVWGQPWLSGLSWVCTFSSAFDAVDRCDVPANPPVSFALNAASECGSPHNPNTLAAYTTGPNVIEPITSMLPSSCTASDPMI